MRLHWIAMLGVSVLFCGLNVEAAPQQPVGPSGVQGFSGTRMATATIMHLNAAVLKMTPLTGAFWVEPNKESPQCQIFIEKGLVFLGYPKASSRKAASFIVDYKFYASISRRLETFFTMEVSLNDKDNTKVWTGTASCSSRTSYNPNGFASSLVACDLNYMNKSAKKTVGIRELLSLHSAMTR